MRRTFCLLAACFLFGTTAAHAESAADAKALLDKAIKAMGGDKLTKLPATTFASKGTIVLNGAKYEYSDDWEVLAPDKFRWNLKLTLNENEVPITFVFTDKAAFTVGGDGKTNDLSEDNSQMYKVDSRGVLLAHWLPALREKGIELKSIGELKIDDRLAVGLKASRKGWPDVDLFFDKETSLPVKMEIHFKETKDGPEVTHILTFHDYKEIDGVKYFSRLKLYRDDTQLVEMEVTDLKRLEKIDDSRFIKP